MPAITCARCERRKPASRRDPDFCAECVREIDRNSANVMERTRAAVEYINRAVAAPAEQRRLRLAAFLDLFHPRMPAARRRALMAGE